MIKFKNVSFVFDDKTIVSGYSEHIKESEHVCLMGESGAGKSTIMKSIMGLIQPDGGKITVCGKEVTHADILSIRSHIAWVPQEVHLPYEFVKEALEAPFVLKVNQSRRFDKDQMFQLFETLSLDKSIYERRMQDISGGERQRLMIALAVMLDKKILLLDEPTSAIDSETREKMIAFLKTINITLFAISHDMPFALTCDRIIRLNKIR